jgi:cbb3-type cytochrome oxidase maturation protein
MIGLAILIPVALALGLIGLAAFFWAIRSRQFDDLDGAALRILNDEGPPPPTVSANPVPPTVSANPPPPTVSANPVPPTVSANPVPPTVLANPLPPAAVNPAPPVSVINVRGSEPPGVP